MLPVEEKIIYFLEEHWCWLVALIGRPWAGHWIPMGLPVGILCGLPMGMPMSMPAENRMCDVT